MPSKPQISKQQQYYSDESRGGFALYRELVVGNQGLLALLRYEIITGLGDLLPGALGYAFRLALYPSLFRNCGRRPLIGKNVTLRNPGGISLGNKVFLDDRATIDCRKGSIISLGDYVALGRDSIIAAKSGDITLANGVNIGTQVRIATQSGVTIGESTLIAAYCYIGPGNHTPNSESGAFISGEMDLKGGVTIGKNVWIGTRATILDGVTIGDGAVIGAHSLVRESVPSGAVVAGTPAKVIRSSNTPQ